MRNKKKNKYTSIFLILFITIAVFRFDKCQANENILLNEVLINGTDKEEFIELYNPTSQEIKLKNYYLVYYSSKRAWDNPYKHNQFPKEAVVKANHFFLIKMKGGLPNSIKSDWDLNYNLSNSNGSVVIFPNNTFEKNNSLDLVAWGKVSTVGKDQELKTTTAGQSFERITIDKNDWQKSYVLNGTPKYKNSKKPILKNYFNKIKINEIYPSPDTKIGETEFIEIKNISNKNINLKDWSASDSIHKGKPLKETYILQPNKFYTFKGKFYLNSSNDKANVFDENGNLVDSLAYGKGRSKYAYAFDGTKWRWTSQPTPNSKNIFDKILSGKISQDKNIYKNIYASFKVKTTNDVQKFTWNFGDGHKSYLKNTRHTYEKTGTYKASLKITGKGEEAFYSFTVQVKTYKPPKIRIISLCANPQGKDTKNEWIEIKNKSQKKVNLKNWSIATGWDKLYNHPIRKDFKIKAGKTKKLKHSICAFTLANSKAKIELRAPDKKVVQKIKYNHKKKPISENEIYQKVKSTWKWILPPIKITSKLPKNTLVKGTSNQKIIPLEIHTTPPITTTPKSLKLNSIPNYLQRKKIFQYGKTFSFSPFTQAPIIVPKNSFPTYSSQINLYLFTTNHPSQHWLIKLTDRLWLKINSYLNHLWLRI